MSVNIYVKAVVAEYEVPISVTPVRDARIALSFWSKFHEEIGIKSNYSAMYHPRLMVKVGGPSKTLEDML